MSQPQILTHSIHYQLPSEKVLFNQLSLAFLQRKIGLVGRNGVGKSTLLKLITGEIPLQSGTIHVTGSIAYVPQNPDFPIDNTLAAVMGSEEKLQALQRISAGSTDDTDYSILNDEWDILDRLRTALDIFSLGHIPLNRTIASLSGGELTRVLLARAFFANSDFLLLDEPTNHLDLSARKKLYEAIKTWKKGLIIVSHDRTLLNLMDEITELNSLGAKSYGGNYDFYLEQKLIEDNALARQLEDAKKLLNSNKTSIQSSREKHEQKQSYGRALRKSGSIDKMGANSKKGRSERTQSKLLIKEERMLEEAETELKSAKEKMEIRDEIHVKLPETKVPNGKLVIELDTVSFSYPDLPAIINQFSMKIFGPAHIALVGDNGSGKSTLIKLILNQLIPQSGKIYRGTDRISYLDQNSDLLDPDISILDNFLILNPDSTQNNAYQHLAAFLFKNTDVLKLYKNLSGGEKIRATLAAVLMSKKPPQLLILDEPTNHLDIQSIEIIENILKCFQGAMIVISHDQAFLQNIGIEKIIYAPFKEI